MYSFYIKEAVSHMKYNLPDRVLRELSSFAKESSVIKIILFGSRARGTNTERIEPGLLDNSILPLNLHGKHYRKL